MSTRHRHHPTGGRRGLARAVPGGGRVRRGDGGPPGRRLRLRRPPPDHARRGGLPAPSRGADPGAARRGAAPLLTPGDGGYGGLRGARSRARGRRSGAARRRLAVVGRRPGPAAGARATRRSPGCTPTSCAWPASSSGAGGRRLRDASRVGELDDLAMQAADDALVAVLRKLPTYRGASRFTTWAAKFAILEASVKARRRAWQDREITLEPEAWERFGAAGSASAGLEHTEQLEAIRDGIRVGAHPAPARDPRRGRAERGPDRRPRRAPRNDPGRDLQDAPRRAPKPARPPRQDGGGMSDRPIAERLLGPDGPELGCDECFEYLDRYVEAEAARGDGPRATAPRASRRRRARSARACLRDARPPRRAARRAPRSTRA